MSVRSTALLAILAFVCAYVALADRGETRSLTDLLAAEKENSEYVTRATKVALTNERQEFRELSGDFAMLFAAITEQATEPSGAEPSEVTETHDAEWRQCPRSRFDLVARFAKLHRSSGLDPRQLYRHVRLNPHDRFVPTEYRDVLRILVASRMDLIQRAFDLEIRVTTKELSRLAEAGRARSVPLERALVPRALSSNPRLLASTEKRLRKRGRDPNKAYVMLPQLIFDKPTPYALHAAEGRMYGARLAELPLTTEIITIRHHMQVDFLAAVVTWFQTLSLEPLDSNVELASSLDRVLISEREGQG